MTERRWTGSSVAAVPITMFVILLAAGGAAQDRVLVPTPPGGGPGISVAERDLEIPFDDGPLVDREALERSLRETLAGGALPDGAKYDELGGDDILISTADGYYDCSIDVAESGDVYAAVEYFVSGSGYQIRVYRSLDGGTTWTYWGVLYDASSAIQYTDPFIHVAEGSVSRCYVACGRTVVAGDRREICVAWSDVAGASASWTEVAAISAAGVWLEEPELASDALTYSTFYLYLVAAGDDADGGDIWFARSIDRGANYEAAYRIGSLTLGDREYIDPSVKYGYGGYVHVTWGFRSRTDSFDDAIRYRRAGGFAGGGLGSWDAISYLTLTTDGYDEVRPKIGASLSGNEVVIGYARREYVDPYYYVRDPGVLASLDQGVSFTISTLIPNGLTDVYGVEQMASTSQWIVAGQRTSSPALHRANNADLSHWSAVAWLADESYSTGSIWAWGMALDPTRGDRCAMIWTVMEVSPTVDRLMFDAEWRADPGYPNLEPGFPLALPYQPISPPAVVDLDGNGDLEIVYGDAGGYVRVYDHNGAAHPGWPQHVAAGLSDGPVAVGDLNGDGSPEVVAGSADGLAHGWSASGEALSGWPFDSSYDDPAYVSIGALGPPYHRYVAVAAGPKICVIYYAGTYPPGSCYYLDTGRTFIAPAAFGDVNGDGVNELVYAINERVRAVQPLTCSFIYVTTVPVAVSDAVTLGDIDLDGDCETLVPTLAGTMHCLTGTGVSLGLSWPYVSGTGTQLTSAALAHFRSGWELDVAFAERNWTVHGLNYDGVEWSGFPASTGSGWYVWGAPIVGTLTGSPDIILGARDSKAWGLSNFGSLEPGWPKAIGQVELSPAMGDIDGDGSKEIVFLTLSEMVVVDINQTVVDPVYETWYMYGHDALRSGCSDCPVDFATAVEEGPEGGAITRVSFAPPSPNPVAGPCVFRYAVPLRAQVRLEIFDLRGRRVATVRREESTPGVHEVSWLGRADDGRVLPSGQYLARLSVRGPGLREQLTRKLTLLK